MKIKFLVLVLFFSKSYSFQISSSLCRFSLHRKLPNSNLRHEKKTSCRDIFGVFVKADGADIVNTSQQISHFEKFKTNYHIGIALTAAFVVGLVISKSFHGFGDLNDTLQAAVSKIGDLGAMGYLYFAAVYILVEILALPALPLTASSGYLFGVIPGTLIVLFSAITAASISFIIGRTLLRNWAKKMADGNSKWRAIDNVIGKEGFKVILLLRLSPLLPFALSNYFYGITAVDFWPYFAASLIGFIPGTVGIVYAGSAGKSLLLDGSSQLPWYYYATIAIAIAVAGNMIAGIATQAITAMENEENKDKNQTYISS